MTASEATGAPRAAWGDSFFVCDPGGDIPADRRMPCATVVTQDYAGFDAASDLNRPGVFLLNIAQPRGAAQPCAGRQPGLGWGDLGAPGAQEPPQLAAPAALLLAHVSSVPVA